MTGLAIPPPADAILERVGPLLPGIWDGDDVRIGGGTALAARWRHRRSTDIELCVAPDLLRRAGEDARTLAVDAGARSVRFGRGWLNGVFPEASMFGVKAGFGLFGRFPGVWNRAFHSLSTSGHRPGKQRHSGRKGATGPLVRSGPGGPPRDTARPGVSRRRSPPCPPTCADRGEGRSRSRRASASPRSRRPCGVCPFPRAFRRTLPSRD